MQPKHVPTSSALNISMDPPDKSQPDLEELHSFTDTDIPKLSSPQKTLAGWPLWHYSLPTCYWDLFPDSPTPIQTLPPVTPGSTTLPQVILHVHDWMWTGMNQFGLLCVYPDRPLYDPDSAVRAEDLLDYYKPQKSNTQPELPSDISQPLPPWPFKNMSTYLLIDSMMTGSSLKSIGEVNHLVKNVINAEHFSIDDLAIFNIQRELHNLDKSEHSECAVSSPFSGDGWTERDIHISVPNGTKGSSGDNFTIPGLYCCPLSAVLKSAVWYNEPTFSLFTIKEILVITIWIGATVLWWGIYLWCLVEVP